MARSEAARALEGAAGDPAVVAWYERKTDFLLEKYGSSPRIHYHTGLFAPEQSPAPDLPSLKAQIWRSQEDLLDRAAAVWDAPRTLSGNVLDIGCGLGGGPLYWAERYGARVVGLTPVPGHLPVIRACAERAGVSHLVSAVLGDAHAAPLDSEHGRFDAVIATGASNYFDRARWFERLAAVLPPGGRVFIEDTFVGRPELTAPFNAYWISNVGAFSEYERAAERAGFRLVHLEDVTDDAAGFWRLSVAWSEQLLARGGLSADERAERRRSIDWQRRVYDAYCDRGFFDLLLHFQRT